MRQKARAAISGSVTGLVNGLLGAGGGMILVPLLSRWNHLEGKQVFATSIAIILPLCLVTLGVFAVHQPLPWQEAVPYLVGGCCGGVLGGLLFPKVSAPLLHKILGCFILWGGIQLLR